jgi:Rhs element Vgr protein
MSDNSTAPASRNEATDLVTFKIKLSSGPISGEYRVVSLNMTKGYNKISFAKVVISDGDPAAQDFPISSKEDGLTPGSEIEISMGYHAQVKVVFKGIVVKHAIKSAKNKASFLTIEAKDKAVKLSLSRKNHCFIEKTDKDIIQEIVDKSGYGGTLDMDTTSPKHKEMVQYNVSDWDFIVSRAEMNGMLVLTDDNKLLIKKPDTSQEGSKEIAYGMDVIEFESEIDGGSQLKEITTHSWNYKDQKIEDSPTAEIQYKENGNLKGDAIAGSLGIKEYRLSHGGNLDKEELKLWGNSKLLKSRMAKSIGKITVKGATEFKVGQVIKLKGFSKRFNGNVLITAIRQHYGTSIWQTDIHFGLPEHWYYQREDIIEKPAAGLIPGINGLQIGIVIQLENDPDKEDRVKIRLPLIDMQEGIWARAVSLDAGKERGSFFRPEINDEVIVGFLNDDPRYPIILGMVNSSAKPAPIKAKDTNHEKGFVTRSKIKLLFNDEKKVVTIETPKGKKIEINDDSDSIIFSDNHRNKISMTSDGITIESGKDISLKASAGDIKMESINIDGKANMKFSAKGNAQAELQSSGQTVVKGSIVNIN